jgi:pimeloyl-ACP methyl ester carboxylesterase
MGAWVWDGVASQLRSNGANVSVVELPSHGADTTPVSGATLDAYVSSVTHAIDAMGSKVVLVGHSMGGVVVTQAAEQSSEKISKLVYLGAYVPEDGQSLIGLASMDRASHLGPVLKIDPNTGTASVPQEKLQDIFCADCSASELSMLAGHYRDEPIAPFMTPVHVTSARWGSVPKAYVYTEQDNAISLSFQQTMTSSVVLEAHTQLETSHSPFLSHPELVTQALQSQ